MSPGQFVALWICVMVGIIGALPMLDYQASTRTRRLCIAWLIFWLTPPLIAVYFTAVMG